MADTPITYEELKRKKDSIEYLWKGKKHICGLPLSFTTYMLSNDRLFYKKGFFNIKIDELMLYRISDVSMKISFGQRILNLGTITILSSDRTEPVLVLKNIKDPEIVKELIHVYVETSKREKGVTAMENVGSIKPPQPPKPPARH